MPDTTKPGGRRAGQGHPTDRKNERNALQTAAMEYLQDPKRLKILLETAYDRATGGGGMVLAKVKWTGRERHLAVGEEECRLADGSTVYLYRLPPDSSLLKSLIELGIGKAPTRGVVAHDTEINVVVPWRERARAEDVE